MSLCCLHLSQGATYAGRVKNVGAIKLSPSVPPKAYSRMSGSTTPAARKGATVPSVLKSLHGFEQSRWMNYLSEMVLFHSHAKQPKDITSLLCEHDLNILPDRFRELQVFDWELPFSLQMPMPHLPHSISVRHTQMHGCMYLGKL